MIEIIRRGKTRDEKVYLADCVTCGSSLKFLGSDAKDEWDRNESFKSIMCPVCQHCIWVKA